MELVVKYNGTLQGMSDDEVKQTEKFIGRVKWGTMGTWSQETGVRLAMMTNLKKQKLDALYFVSPFTGEKMDNIRKNPDVEVIFARKRGQVIIHGKAEIIEDEDLNQEEIFEIAIQFVPVDMDFEGLCLIKIVPENIKAAIQW